LKWECFDSPSVDQLDCAVALVNEGGKLKFPLNRAKLVQCTGVIVAVDENATVVGVAAIKKAEDNVAEIGYLVVQKELRGKGIGKGLTAARVALAKRKGLSLIYSNIRQDNIESNGDAKKAGYS
jgi:predicted GNAT family acetyltransferase